MGKAFPLVTAGLLLSAVAVLTGLHRFGAASGAPAPVDVAEPGGDAASATQAQNKPDEYAWKLFEYINLPADPSKAGVPATGKTIGQFDTDQPTVWETWALASGEGDSQEGSEVFLPTGGRPLAWQQLHRGGALKPLSIDLKVKAQRLQNIIGSLPAAQIRTTARLERHKGASNLLIGPTSPDAGFEVRMNQAAFEFVRGNQFYNIEGLEAALTKARSVSNRSFVQFPPAAKEIKADWIPAHNPASISADEKARYHWRIIGGKYYLLTGFHITTKDLKEWFWADFAQEDFETTPGPALPSMDATTRGAAASDRGTVDGERRELTGTIWAHYRLRGTQIAFVSGNKPVIVGNTMIESGFADQSSCMTCHFRAGVGDLVGQNPKTLSPGDTAVGMPDTSQLGSGSNIAILQNDFEWSAPFRAQHQAH